MNQPPVQSDGAIGAGTAPARACAAQAQFAPLHMQGRGKVVQPFSEKPLRLAHQPGLYSVLDLLRRGGVRQPDVERESRDAGQGISAAF